MTVAGSVDAVYAERNAVVLAFARAAQALGWPVGRLEDPDEPGWPVIVVETPEGQVSWHVPVSEGEDLFEFPPHDRPWDGHTSEEKYERLGRWRP